MNKLVLVLAALAIANAAVSTNSPTSAGFSVAVGTVFLNSTASDASFINYTGPVVFTGGFDNVTNYVWVQNFTYAGSNSYTSTFIRRAFNGSAPGTVNATNDVKISTSFTSNSSLYPASAPGVLGVAYTYGTGSNPQNDVYVAAAAVNATAFTTVKITTNTAQNLNYAIQSFWYDTGIFYVVYSARNGSTAGTTIDNSLNNLYVQGVSVATGAVVYNSTGGVSLMAPTTVDIRDYDFTCAQTNITNTNASTASCQFTDSTGTYNSYKLLPITLATGAAGAVQTLATADANNTYSFAGALGSFYNTAVFIAKQQDVAGVLQNSTLAFFNGSASASTTFNITVPTGYRLTSVSGLALVDGAFTLIETFSTTTTRDVTPRLVQRENFFSNGTLQAAGASLGTFSNNPGVWQDATNSIWIGYATSESFAAYGSSATFVVGGYAGELQFQELSANTLAGVFASLALMIAALFAF